MADELVVRVVLKPGADRDTYAQAITTALGMNPGVDMVTVDLNESGSLETIAAETVGGLTLEETRRLYVRFGPRPDERVRLARQQFSMLGMLMNTPTVRGTEKLMERLRAWDAFTWSEAPESSATKVYSRLADALEELAKRLNVLETGMYQLTRRKGVYGFAGVIRETRRKRR